MQLNQISIYIDLLLRWNARINLTAIRSPEEIVTRHFGESLFLARHLFPDPSVARAFLPAANSRLSRPPHSTAQTELVDAAPFPTVPSAQPARVIDVGSGAGFPGLPLKIWAPKIHLTLIESNHKKAAFLREVIRALTLTNINVTTDRAETIAARLAANNQSEPSVPRASLPTIDARPRFADLVTLRAVENFASIVPIAVNLAKPSGCVALLIGQSQKAILENLRLPIKESVTLAIPESQSRVLTTLVRD